MRLRGKVALITGAGQGIGRAIALAFAQEGADIAVNALHKETSEATAEEIRKLGQRVVSIPADVSLPHEVAQTVAMVLDALGTIDILVNTAGGGSRFFPMLDFPLEDWERVMALNLRSAYLCSQCVGRWMAKQNAGKILNMASVNAYGGSPLRSAYAPAKAGIVNLTMVMAVELGKYNINVNCLAPGVVLVPRIKRLAEQKVFNLEGVVSRTPLGRLCEPEDVAKAAVFLVSEEAAAITGVTLTIDGGWLANRTLV